MELRHLRYFAAVAEELNMRRAAERLNVSQPPLSRQIRDLEDELGTLLFERKNRKLCLTKAGEYFLKEANGIFSRARLAAQLTRSISRGESGTLTIAAGYIAGTLPATVLKEYHERFPSVEIVMKQMTPSEQLVALLDRSIDIGFVGLCEIELQDVLSFKGIFHVGMLAVLPVGHALLKQRKVRLESCSDQPFVFLERAAAPAVHDGLVNLCRQAGFTPAIVQRAERPQLLLQLVAAGFGISIVPDLFQSYPVAGLAYRPLAGKTPKAVFSVAWRRDNPSPLLRSFRDILFGEADRPHSTSNL